ncbi:MAG: hypothetical protein ACR2IS_17085 [Nitrososphaeraceae archaeon]
MAAYATDDYDGGDESETNTEQKIKQSNDGSGDLDQTPFFFFLSFLWICYND